MNSQYPIMLHLKERKAVVIGGGNVAENKVRGLLDCGAHVKVVSPEITVGLAELHKSAEINWFQKKFSPEDLEGAFLVFAATNNKEVNQLVGHYASSEQLVLIADDPVNSDFQLPATVRRGHLCLAVSTGGASPVLAKKIRDHMAEEYDERYEAYLDFLFQARQQIIKEIKDSGVKRKLLAALAEGHFLNSNSREEDFLKLYQQFR